MSKCEDAILSYVFIYGIWDWHIAAYSRVVVACLAYRLIRDGKILAPSKIVSSKSAEDILDERYVKGELTREQYVQMKEDIKKPTQV
jgi:uncharacterized membrane protein